MELFLFPADIAKICESNLRKNFLYGGRRHLPFAVEMEALLVWGLGAGEGGWQWERLCWGSVTGEVGVSGEEMELGMCSAKEWAGNRQVL